MEGTIATLTDKGFGFITPADGSKDIFFHARDLVNISFDDLQKGDDVSFEVEDSPKGLRAVEVTVLN